MRDNRGLSLIELIVVIAILSIISVGAFSGIGMLSSWNVNKCAKGIDSALKKTKTTAMSKSNAELILSKSDGDYYIESTEEQKKKIGSEPIVITYTTTEGNTITIDGTNTLTLRFDRSSGAYQRIGETSGTDVKDIYCTSIILTRGSKQKVIELVYATGKHVVK